MFSETLLHISLEVVVAVVVVYLLVRWTNSKKKSKSGPKLNCPSKEEQERRIAEFKSLNFRSDAAITSNVMVPSSKGGLEVHARDGCRVTVTGGTFTEPTECLDLCTYDYHSLSTKDEVVDVARKTVVAYGVGSCGPRGFFGTIKPHLVCEKDIARFMGTEDCVVYSFSYATVATLIPCFSGKSDYLVVDADVCHAVREGCILSRSKASYYAHNDMASLEEALKAVVAKENPKKPNRRYVVTEGVFKNSGDICHLDKIADLCERYKFRIILEDSFGFGAVGKSGRGTPELLGVPLSKICLYVGAMHTALGAVGGFTVCTHALSEFQRLGAAAYTFSASLPPYVTASASKAVSILDTDASYVERLQQNARLLRAELAAAQLPKDKITVVHDGIDDSSPIICLRATDAFAQQGGSTQAADDALQRVVNALQREKIVVSRILNNSAAPVTVPPTLRIIAKSGMTEAEVKDAAAKISRAIKKELAA